MSEFSITLRYTGDYHPPSMTDIHLNININEDMKNPFPCTSTSHLAERHVIMHSTQPARYLGSVKV